MPAGTPVQLGSINDSAADPVVITLGAGANVGDLVIVTAGNIGATATAVTDSRGNSYTRTVNDSGGGFCGVLIAWSRITTALQSGDTVSITTGFTALHVCAQVVQVTNIVASPLDQTSTHADTVGSANFTSNATPTTSQADDFLFGAITINGSGGTPNQPGGWTGSPTTPTFNVAGQDNGRRDYEAVSSTGAYAYSGTITSSQVYAAGIIAFKAAAAAGAALPTPPLPRAFQEQGRIYSGEQTGFQPLAFQIPDPGRAFQEGTRFGEPKAFQDQAFQIPDPGVAFQPEGFDTVSVFQMSVVAFQEPTGFQGDAFQEFTGLERRTPRVVQAGQRSTADSRRRFYRARGHRQARIIRAPQQSVEPEVSPQHVIPKRDRRAFRIARGRHRPIILKAPVAAPVVTPTFVRPTILVREDRRVPLARRKRRLQILRAPLAALPPKTRVQTHERQRPTLSRTRRRRPLVLRAPAASLPSGARPLVHRTLRAAWIRKTRRVRPQILRGVSTPTPPPVTGIPVKRVFVYGDRRAAFVRARHRTKQILRGVSTPTPVPWIRNHVYVSKRARNPIFARARHKTRSFTARSFAPPLRPPLAIVRKQRRRYQQKRRKTQIIRSVPLWQRPRTPLIVGQHRKAGIAARLRRKLHYVVSHVYGPPPPPPTDSGFGLVFLSDVPLYDVVLADGTVTSVSVAEAVLYDVGLADAVLYDESVREQSLFDVTLSDIPGR